MEDKPNRDNADEESLQRKESESTNNDQPNTARHNDTKICNSNDAGPSTTLPGSVEPTKVPQAGLSKSEHNIRHIITRNDVAAALKMSSVNFTPNNLNKNMNFKDIIIPGVHKGNTNLYEMESIKNNLLKSCLTKDGRNIREVSNISEVHTVLSNANSNVRAEVANSSCITTANIAKITNVKTVVNDLLQTNKVPEVKVNKVPNGSNNSVAKKKTSGNISERSDFGITQRDSMSSIGSNVCRICMTRGRERLISPCNCKGSLANVHLTCLERWLNQVGRNHCELCGFSYPAIRTPRYTVLQALRLWFGNPRNRSHLQSDCLIFWLLSTVTAGLLAVCIVGTQYFVLEGSKFGKPDAPRKEGGLSHRITETAMDFFMAIVLCGYSVTVYLLWKDHYVMWNRWRRANVNVRLLLTPDSNPVPFVPRSRYNIV